MIYFESGEPGKAAETEPRALKLKPDNASYKKALENTTRQPDERICGPENREPTSHDPHRFQQPEALVLRSRPA